MLNKMTYSSSNKTIGIHKTNFNFFNVFLYNKDYVIKINIYKVNFANSVFISSTERKNDVNNL